MRHMNSGEFKDFLGRIPEIRHLERRKDLYLGLRRPREVNPEAFDARIKFWEVVIAQAVNDGLVGSSYFCTPHSTILTDAFTYDNLRPEGLSIVLVRLSLTNTYIYIKSRMMVENKARPVKGNPKPNLIWRTFKLLTSLFIEYETEDNSTVIETQQDPIILTQLLEEFVCKLVEFVLTNEHRRNLILNTLGDRKDFEELVNSCRIHHGQKPLRLPFDFELILESLKKREIITLVVEEGQEYFKIIHRSGLNRAITSEEVNLIRLKGSLREIDLLINNLSRQYEKGRELAKAALEAGDREYALQHVKRMKFLERNIKLKREARCNIVQIMNSIEELFENIKVFEAYEVGNATLKQLLQENSISSEKVHEVLDESAALLNQVSDVSAALSGLDLNVNNEELETELEELKNEQASADVFPSIPASKPVLKYGHEGEIEIEHKEIISE